MVFTCYLDEARTDNESPHITMAGYIGAYSDWLPFEAGATAVFTEYDVEVLHGYDLENGRKDFQGWSRAEKEAFVEALSVHLRPTGVMGFAYSVAKSQFAAAKKQHKVMPSESPYGYCFRSVAELICDDPVMRMNFDNVPGADISFILETGAANKGDVDRIFAELKRTSLFRGRLKAVTFASKDSTKSLQMADLLAFYVARHHTRQSSGKADRGVQQMLDILHTKVHVESWVAEDFRLNKAAMAWRDRRKSSREISA